MDDHRYQILLKKCFGLTPIKINKKIKKKKKKKNLIVVGRAVGRNQ
jgi:hypothetical protein